MAVRQLSSSQLHTTQLTYCWGRGWIGGWIYVGANDSEGSFEGMNDGTFDGLKDGPTLGTDEGTPDGFDDGSRLG